MPVIRQPNYTDHAWDVPLDSIQLVVGNEAARPLFQAGGGSSGAEQHQQLQSVSLRDFLSSITSYTGLAGLPICGLLAERDSHALVSAQACFLPVAEGGEAEFQVGEQGGRHT